MSNQPDFRVSKKNAEIEAVLFLEITRDSGVGLGRQFVFPKFSQRGTNLMN